MIGIRELPADRHAASTQRPAPSRARRAIRALPNGLTVLRLLLAGALPFVAPGWRLPVVLCAGVSDALDGWIARRFDAATVLGSILDGVADKAFVLAVLVTLLLEGELAWWQAGLLVTRDLTVGATFVFVLWSRQWGAFAHMDARFPGKLTTLVLFGWFVAVLTPLLQPAAPVLFWGAAACSLGAALDYAVRFTGLVRHGEQAARA